MINNKKMTYILTIIITLAFLAGVFLLAERHKKEESFKNTEVIVNLQELEILAYANNKDLSEVVKEFQNSGVTTILLREKTLGDLERSGDLEIIKGNNGVFLKVLNNNFNNQVEKSILSKSVGRISSLNGENLIEIPAKVPTFYSFEEGLYKILDNIGIGFDHDQIDILNDLNVMVVPQIRSWKNYSQESIDFIAGELNNISNISIILSNDSTVAGFPSHVDVLIEAVNPYKSIPVGMVEFFNQTGLGSFVYKNNMNAVRIHSISDKEMLNFTEKKALDRYLLSVEERNIRGIYVKLFNLDNPMNSYESNLKYTQKITGELTNSGFVLDQASIIKHEKQSILYYGLITAGLIAGVWMIFIKMQTPILGLSAAVGISAFILLTFISNSMMALKVTALLIVLVYPVLAFTSVIEYKDNFSKATVLRSLKDAVSISVVTFSGGLMMAALLSFTPFMIKTDQFSGVKVAHLIPLIVIPLLLIFWNKDGIKNLKKLFNTAIEYKVAVAGVLGAAALGYYMLRTGNQGAGLVLGIEERFRDALNYYLGVRPRTKEFLIGYPSLVLLTYLGLNKRTWILLFPAIIGQISLANTYAHIHTSIMVSLQRSGLGIIIGLVIGVVLILCWNVLEKLYEKLCQKYFN